MDLTQTPVNIALVGAGKFGERHLANLMRLQNEDKCRLVAVVDVSKDQLGNLERRYGCRVETSLDRVLPEVDAVDIVTPASTHFQIAKKCLLSDKHVMIEKPMTTSFKEALEIQKLGAARKKIVEVGHVFRYNILTRALKKSIGEMIQDSLLIDAQFLNPNEPRKDVGSILNYSHWVDLCNFLLQDTPSTVAGFTYHNSNSAYEDSATVVMNYSSGTQSNLMMGWAGRQRKRYFAVESAEVTFVADYLKGSLETLTGERRKQIQAESVSLPVDSGSEPLFLELADFLHSVKSGETPLADSRSGVVSVYVCEMAGRSAVERRTLECDGQVKIFGGEVFATSDSIAVR